MKKAKAALILAYLSIFLVYSILIALPAFAALSDIQQSIVDAMDFFIGTLSALTGRAALSSVEAKIGFLRFLIGMCVFIVTYAGISRIPAFNNRTAAALSLVFAGFSLLLNPNIVFSLGSFYILVIVALMLGIPTLGLVYVVFIVPPHGAGFAIVKLILSVLWIGLLIWSGDILKLAIETHHVLSAITI